MNAAEEALLRETLEQRSRALTDEVEIERLWQELCEGLQASYMSILRGHGRLLRGLNCRWPFATGLYSRWGFSPLLAIIECETHHEALATAPGQIHRRKTTASKETHIGR